MHADRSPQNRRARAEPRTGPRTWQVDIVLEWCRACALIQLSWGPSVLLVSCPALCRSPEQGLSRPGTVAKPRGGVGGGGGEIRLKGSRKFSAKANRKGEPQDPQGSSLQMPQPQGVRRQVVEGGIRERACPAPLGTADFWAEPPQFTLCPSSDSL